MFRGKTDTKPLSKEQKDDLKALLTVTNEVAQKYAAMVETWVP